MRINRKNDTELQTGQKTCTSLWLVNFHKFRVTYMCGYIDNIIFNCPRIGEKWSSECCRAGVMMQYFHTPWMEISISVSFYWNSDLLWYNCARFLLSYEPLYYDKKIFTKRHFKWSLTESRPCLSLILNLNQMQMT